jgi:type II secretory pathway pseudopilin PulG
MFKNYQKRFLRMKKQKGLTLIELGLAIAISAAIIVGLMVTLTSTNQSKKIMQATQLVSQLISAATNYGATGADDDIAGKLENAGLVNSITTPWGKDATVIYNSDSDGIIVTIPGVNDGTCQAMYTQWQAQKSVATADCSTQGVFKLTYKMDVS